MEASSIISLIVGLAGVLTAIITIIANRRKTAAEALKLEKEAGESESESEAKDVDAFDKFSDLLKKLQDRNAELYNKNVELEVKSTEKTRHIENLMIRLEERDSQLTAATRQLELLRELAKQSNTSETLKTQLEATNTIIANLQEAQKQMATVLTEREKTYQQLFESTKNLLPGAKKV